MSKEISDLEGGRELIQYKRGTMVTIFGSARTPNSSPVYKQVETLGALLADYHCTVMTGGGSKGLMDAASKGCYLSGGVVLGAGIKLPFEQSMTPYLTHGYDFENFHIRKKYLIYYSDVIVCAEGGWGTVEEITEVLTLMQTNKLRKVPIFFLGSEYWKGMIDWFENTLYRNGNIGENDLKLYTVTDNIMDIIDCVKGL